MWYEFEEKIRKFYYYTLLVSYDFIICYMYFGHRNSAFEITVTP